MLAKKYRKQIISKIGERIKRCRLALRMNKAQLASKAGLSRPAITYYENRNTKPTLQSLRKLADALGVSVCDSSDQNVFFDHSTSGFSDNQSTISGELMLIF